MRRALLVRPARGERGAAMFFFFVILLAFLIALGLSVDMTRVNSAHSEKWMSTEYLAMSALDMYLTCESRGTCAAGNIPSHADAAIARAKELGGVNFVTAQWKALELDPANDCLEGGSTTCAMQGKPVAGRVTFGRWWTEQPSNCLLGTCPCGAVTLPCLESCGVAGCDKPDDPSNPVKLLANAVALQLQTKTGSPIRQLFLGLFTNGSTSITAGESEGAGANKTIASVIPRDVVFLFDLSKEVQAQTYKGLRDPRNPTTAYFRSVDGDAAADYAIKVVPNPAYSGPTTLTCANVYSFLFAPGPRPNPFPFKLKPDYMDAQWANWQTTAAYSTYIKNGATYHYDCQLNATTGEVFLLGNADGAKPPQPLTAMTASLAQILSDFSLRGSQLDKVGIIGFDHALLTGRVFKAPTAAGDPPRMFGLYSNDFASFTNALTTRSNAFQAQLVPKPHDSPKAYNLGATVTPADPESFAPESYLKAAVDEAMVMFNHDPESSTSRKHLVYMGTSASTCTVNFQPGLYCASDTLQTTLLSYNEFNTADLLDSSGVLRTGAVRMHTLLYGQGGVSADTNLLHRVTGTPICMLEGEKNKRGYMHIVPKNAAGLGAGTAGWTDQDIALFYLDAAVRLLNGVWGPIRPSCAPIVGAGVARSSLDTVCATATGAYASPPASVADPLQTYSYLLTPPVAGFPNPSVLDPTGRMLCDPGDRALVDQAVASWQEMMAEQPIALVHQ